MAESFFRVRKGIIVANTIASANLDPLSLTIGSTVVNGAGLYAATINVGTITGITSLPALGTITVSQSFNVGALFTANSTLVNAAAINVTGQINAASMFLTGLANVSTLYATTSANVGANVQLSTSFISIGNTSVNTFANSSQLRVSTIVANGAIGTANQAILSNGTTNFWGSVEMLGVARTQNYQPATSYTLALTDAGKTIIADSVTTHTLTIPPFASVAFPNDTYVNFIQWNSGLIHFAAGAGVTILSRNGTNTGGLYAIGTMYKVSTNVWVLGGDLK